MSDEPTAPGRQQRVIKNMDDAEWQKTRAHVTARREPMGDFAARAFRVMREMDQAGPQYIPPPSAPPPGIPREYREQAQPPRLTIETVAELAALMHGAASMASAAGLRVPESHARDALRLARLTFGQIRDALPRRPQPEALRLANERRRLAAQERRA